MKPSALELVVRPIVEGQIRGFLKEHPSIVEAVDWYKPRDDKAVTFTNSLTKRIVNDLVCGSSRLRIRAALLELATEGAAIPCGGTVTADGDGLPGIVAGQADAAREARQ